jgi:hypothetical protein
MAKMAAAVFADDFGTAHAQAIVGNQVNGIIFGDFAKSRPADQAR